MEEVEEWRDVAGYEGLYMVSNCGRVKSVERTVNRAGGTMRVGEKILSQGTTTSGYRKVNLSNLGTQKMFDVHILVAISFLFHSTSNRKIVIDHIDGNKLNNYLFNLRIVTSRFNNSTQLKINNSNKASNLLGASIVSKYNKWSSSIRYNKKSFYLGMFDTEIEASTAYSNALSLIENGGFYDYMLSIKRKFSSNTRGVSFNKKINRWVSYYRLNKKMVVIGRYKTENDAILAITDHNNKL